MERLDHGILNIPGRLNNINRELDRYKAEQAAQARRDAKAATAKRKADKARAKELVALHGAAFIERHAAKFGAKEVAKTLDQMMKWEPAQCVSMLERFAVEA